MAIRESSFGYWSSYRGFVFVAAGAAAGIGNLARLPYLASLYGGSVFIGAYLLALFILAWPLLVMELSVGRWARADLVSGIQRYVDAAGARRAWTWLGGATLVAAVMILSYYSVIAGWSLAYVFRAAGGALGNADTLETARDIFYTLAKDPERGLAWHTIFMVIACVIVAHGVLEGIERAALYLLPAAFVLIVILLIYALTIGDGPGVMQQLFHPDFSRFGWRGAMEAVHQAFFTMALGLGAMAIYGSYLPARAPLARLALAVVVVETLFTIIGGYALYALVLGAGLSAAPGLTLLFQLLPLAVQDGVTGAVVCTAVYVVIVIITLIAAAALMEPATRYLMDRLRTTRVFAATMAALGIWTLGLLSLLSFNILQDVKLLGGTFFDWFQTFTGLLLPSTSLLLCVFVARIIPHEVNLEAWGDQPRWLLHFWMGLLRYPVRIGLILLLLYVSGVLDFFASLWS